MPNPSLAELDKQKEQQQQQQNTGIKPGDGTPPPPNLNDEQKKLEAEQAAAAARIDELKDKDVNTLTPAEIEELKKAGFEIKDTPGSGKDDGEEEDEDDTADADPTAFWNRVDELRGEKVEIKWEDYKDEQGNPIDPVSPEGVLIREKAVAEATINKFESHLRATDPRGYAYLLHRQAGGTDEDFFATKTTTLPEYETFKNSVDLQQQFYKQSLILKGVPEKAAQLTVDEAVKNKTIFQDADAEYKQRQQAQEKDLKRIEKQLADEQAAYTKSVQTFDKMLTDEITSNSTMKFIVPDAKKIEFTQYVRNHVQAVDGKFVIVQDIEQKNLGRLLEALYLQFVGGNVKDLVQRQAQTQVTKRLVLAVDKNKNKQKDSGSGSAPKKKTLGEL